jgi:hypothetical protein
MDKCEGCGKLVFYTSLSLTPRREKLCDRCLVKQVKIKSEV